MKTSARLTVAGAIGVFSAVIVSGAAFAVGGSVFVPDVSGQTLQTHGVGTVTASQSALKSLKIAALASGFSPLSIHTVRAGDAVVVSTYRGVTSGASRAGETGKLNSEFRLDPGMGNSTQVPRTPQTPSPIPPLTPVRPGGPEETPPAAQVKSDLPNSLVNHEAKVHAP